MTKRITLMLAAAALLSAACAKPEEGPVSVTGVTLDKKEIALKEGATFILKATVLPENATDKTCRWSSGDEAVATVSDGGEVLGVSAGNTVIRVCAGTVSDSCLVSVVKDEILVQKASFDKSALELFANASAVLVLTTEPSVVTETPVWASSDDEVATIDSTGTVTAVAAGKATVSATFRKSGKKASCSVTVTEPLKLSKVDAAELIVQGTRVNERKDTLRVARGETADLQIYVKANAAVDGLDAELAYFCKDGNEGGLLLEPELFWTRKVKCTRHWDEWWGNPYYEITPGDRMFPDPLMPVGEWNVSLAQGESTCLWCDIDIPRGFGEGLYCAAVRIKGGCAGESVVAEKKFYVQVYPIDLPESQNLKVINWLYNGFYDPMNNGSHDYDEYEMKGIVMDFMSRYGQNGWLMGDNAPTGPDMKIEDGNIVCDFSRFLQEMEFFEEHCPDLSIVEGSAFCSYNDYGSEEVTADDMRCPVYFIENDTIKLRGLPPTDARTREWFVNLFSQFGDFAKAHSLKNGRRIIDVYAQSIMDEPKDRHVSGYDMVAGFIKEGCPDVKIIEPIETSNLNKDNLDYPIPNLDNLTVSNEAYKAGEQQRQWLYVCQRPQGNIANRLFGMRAIKPRIIHWCNFFFDAEGYLHWGLNRWDSYYEKDSSGKRTYSPEIYDKDMYLGIYPGGDYFFIWPGYKKVYPSIRLCNMRDGVRDYELLRMVEAKDPDKAAEICRKVVYEEWKLLDEPTGQSTTGKYLFYDENVVNFRQTRREMLEFLAN